MKQHYEVERDGQIAFFKNYHIDYKDPKHKVLIDYTDGVVKGNLLEFKLNISNLGSGLFQAIKYLSHLRVKGKNVPATILLIDLNNTKAYVFKSEDYRQYIERLYIGAASKHNDAFGGDVVPIKTIDYSTMLGDSDLKKLLKQTLYMPVTIDTTDVVKWAERYYKEVDNATKGDFLRDVPDENGRLGEIRQPDHFEGLILPYKGKTNENLKYLMDKLNDRMSKKDLGAFYTPEPYAKKACELVLDAVNRVPKGNDYIILDRCAGTGNLEVMLKGMHDKNGDKLIHHVVCSTYEYFEYRVLAERLDGINIRALIPPTEQTGDIAHGRVNVADAMSKQYINNPILQKYVNDPKTTIILFENPPYRDVSTSDEARAVSKDYILTQMKFNGLKGTMLNDLSNRFIWSGLHYYLRNPSDSYVLFSPVKYFKLYHFMNKLFVKGYLFNRKHFHASGSGISCVLWNNIDCISPRRSYKLTAYDIDKDNKLVKEKVVTINTAEKKFTDSFYDHTQEASDQENGICCNLDGTERASTHTLRVKKLYNPDIIGYLRASSFNINARNQHLLRCGEYDANGFFLRKNTYLKKLPLWVAKEIPLKQWYEKGIYATTADGGTAYEHDKDFLKECLIYTVLSNKNKCLSLNGSDGRYYRNELCLDTTNGDTVASADLAKMSLNSDEKKLVNLWKLILKQAKATKNYNSKFTYGIWQITNELNTHHKEDGVSNSKTVYDYPILNGYLTSLKKLLKQYYLDYIKDKMFKYELIK